MQQEKQFEEQISEQIQKLDEQIKLEEISEVITGQANQNQVDVADENKIDDQAINIDVKIHSQSVYEDANETLQVEMTNLESNQKESISNDVSIEQDAEKICENEKSLEQEILERIESNEIVFEEEICHVDQHNHQEDNKDTVTIEQELSNLNNVVLNEENLELPTIPLEPKQQILQSQTIEDTDNKYDYLLKYDYTINKEESYMKRKLNSLQSEVISSFGQNGLELKKSYSRLEKEKIELEKKKREEDQGKIITSKENINLINTTVANSNFPSSSFMTDAKVYKSRLEQEKEASKSKLFLGAKREKNLSEALDNSSFSLKKHKDLFHEDWSTLMSNSVKKKSTLELEKEKFLEECKKKKEELLKNQNQLAKSHVYKFEDFSDTKESSKLNTSSLKNNESNYLNSILESKICTACNGPIEHNYKQLSQKCQHFMHTVK
jgi:hypothetical protein